MICISGLVGPTDLPTWRFANVLARLLPQSYPRVRGAGSAYGLHHLRRHRDAWTCRGSTAVPIRIKITGRWSATCWRRQLRTSSRTPKP